MSEDIQSDMGATLAKGITGVVGVFGGIAIANISTINAWLQTVSLVVGIAVGVATLVSVLRKKK